MPSSLRSSEIERAYLYLAQRWGDIGKNEQLAHLDTFAIDFSYHSGGLENDEITLHDTREVFDRNGLSSFTGDLRTVFEMANLKAMWEWTIERVPDGFSFTEDELLSCHEMLTRGTYDQRRWELGERPGQYKHHMYEVADGVGDFPQDVPQSVASTLADVRDALVEPHDGLASLAIAAYAHAMLVDIHPFADGNGRVARQLANMVLLACSMPPVLVPKEDRVAYFGALDAFYYDDDLSALQQFLAAESLKYWDGKLNDK